MGLNVKCPKCGSTKVQLSNEENKHGCLYFVLFGWIYFIWLFFKWCIGAFVFLFIDWWVAIIKNSSGKSYVWKCKRFFSNKRRIYYCHDCGTNFKS